MCSETVPTGVVDTRGMSRGKRTSLTREHAHDTCDVGPQHDAHDGGHGALVGGGAHGHWHAGGDGLAWGGGRSTGGQGMRRPEGWGRAAGEDPGTAKRCYPTFSWHAAHLA